MSAYLDTSVLIPSLVDEPASPAVNAYIGAGGQELFVSDFAAAELAAALSRLVRTGIYAIAAATERLGDFEAWRAAQTVAVEVHAADVRVAYNFVRRFDLMLRAPDALHLAIARRVDATLVTLDRRLARAAGSFGLAVAEPR
jgi:uncharacterized protein